MSDQTRECPRCGTRQEQGWLCDGCRRHVRVTLRAIAHDWPDLMDAFTRVRGIPTESEGHGKGGGQPLPYDERAAEVSHHVRAVLVSWVKLTIEELHADSPGDRIGAMAAHLTAWLPVVRRQEWALEFADEVDDLHAWLIGALQQGEGKLVTLQRAACPDCDGALVARVGLDWSRNPMIRCRTCTREWGAGAWDELMAQSQERDDQIPEEQFPAVGSPDWATAVWIAEALGVSVAAVRTAAWRYRWTKRHAGAGADGRVVVYLLADVGQWWRDRAERRRSVIHSA